MIGFCIFGEEMVFLDIAVKITQIYLLSVGHVRE